MKMHSTMKNRYPAQGTYIVQNIENDFNLRMDVIEKFTSLGLAAQRLTLVQLFFCAISTYRVIEHILF